MSALGQNADIRAAKSHVRFTPNSGHVRCKERCPLCANSGHSGIHSITSSARESTAGGMVRPSALAVLRFITVSYLVGACTGRSAGLLALEDTVDVAGRAPILVERIGRVGDEAAGGGER